MSILSQQLYLYTGNSNSKLPGDSKKVCLPFGYVLWYVRGVVTNSEPCHIAVPFCSCMLHTLNAPKSM